LASDSIEGINVYGIYIVLPCLGIFSGSHLYERDVASFSIEYIAKSNQRVNLKIHMDYSLYMLLYARVVVDIKGTLASI
jgi:hypothetical protein